MGDTDCVEYNTLLQCFGTMVTHFAATELISLDTALVEKGLLPVEVSDELESLGGSNAKAKKIAKSVLASVKAQPSKYSDLVAVLKKIGLSELVTMLQDKKKELSGGNPNRSSNGSSDTGKPEASNKGKTLSIANILKEFRSENGFPASEAKSLGIFLELPPPKLKEFQRNNMGDVEGEMQAVLGYWLRNDENKSWGKLADAVEFCHHKLLADRIKQKYT